MFAKFFSLISRQNLNSIPVVMALSIHAEELFESHSSTENLERYKTAQRRRRTADVVHVFPALKLFRIWDHHDFSMSLEMLMRIRPLRRLMQTASFLVERWGFTMLPAIMEFYNSFYCYVEWAHFTYHRNASFERLSPLLGKELLRMTLTSRTVRMHRTFSPTLSNVTLHKQTHREKERRIPWRQSLRYEIRYFLAERRRNERTNEDSTCFSALFYRSNEGNLVYL